MDLLQSFRKSEIVLFLEVVKKVHLIIWLQVYIIFNKVTNINPVVNLYDKNV
jgi:hypothetical protein